MKSDSLSSFIAHRSLLPALLLAAVVALCAITTFAAIPQQINYQGYLSNPSGSALDTTVAMTFKLYSDSLAGSLFWTEVRPAIAVASGLFNVRLGQLTALTDAILNQSQVWLGIQVGADPEMTPRTRIVSVGYSYRVGTVDGASGGTITSDVTIAGRLIVGSGNIASGDHAFAVGLNNVASGNFSSVTGGDPNIASGLFSHIGGGQDNTATGDYSSITGGESDTASGMWSHVGGGHENKALGENSTVSGGYYNSNSAFDGTISGGYGNIITATTDATIGGGYENTASDQFTTIAGGYLNAASQAYATIGGGTSHVASGVGSTIAGGNDNDAIGSYTTVAGGNNNSALSQYGAIGGGQNNQTGQWGTVPGGFNNYAGGNYSFAAGRDVNSTSVGAFIWGSSSTGSPTSPAANYTVTFRCENGARFYTHASNTTTGVNLPAGGGAWASLSDSTTKRNIRLVDTRTVLEKVSQLPIKQWSYKSQDPSIEHIGPIAQDFYNLFAVGDDNKTISTVDPDGIALAAIQELAKQNSKLQTSNSKLETEIAELRAAIQTLQADQKQSHNKGN